MQFTGCDLAATVVLTARGIGEGKGVPFRSSSSIACDLHAYQTHVFELARRAYNHNVMGLI